MEDYGFNFSGIQQNCEPNRISTSTTPVSVSPLCFSNVLILELDHAW